MLIVYVLTAMLLAGCNGHEAGTGDADVDDHELDIEYHEPDVDSTDPNVDTTDPDVVSDGEDGGDIAADEGPSTWRNRIQLTIDHTRISSSLTDFPLLVHLSSSSGINEADVSVVLESLGSDANRQKIAVRTSSEEDCYVEIEAWDTASQQAWLWVKVPTLSSSEDTVLYLYYDDAHADNTDYVGDTGSDPARSVWDSGFKLVFHFADSGTTFLDSTANGHEGTKIGGVTTAPGLIGPSAQFDGSSGSISVPDSDDFSLTTAGHLLVSTWFSPTVLVMDDGSRTDGQNRFFSKSANSNHEWLLNYYNKDSDRDMGIAFYLCNLAGGLCCGHYADPYGSPDNYLEPGEWEQLIGRGDIDDAVIDGATRIHWVSVYKNGVFKHGQSYDGTGGSGCTEASGMQVTPANGTAPVTLGHSPATGSWLNGRLDEARIDAAARSDAWIAADYESQNDSLVSFLIP